MENYKNYLNNKLLEFKKDLEQKFVIYKEGLQAELNQAMLQHIKEAEEQIEKSKKRYADNYERAMKELEEEKSKNGGNPDNNLFKMQEDFHKNIFERGLRMTMKLWTSFIEDCRANIK